MSCQWTGSSWRSRSNASLGGPATYPSGSYRLMPREHREMSTLEAVPPPAIHLGADDIPFVEIGGGNLMKVLHVSESQGYWVVENVFQTGFAVPPHRHTGPVWAFTVSGAWKYAEYD